MRRFPMLKGQGDLLPLASFCGTPCGLDETGIVNCVFKAGCAVGARMHVTDEVSVDPSHVDRCTHKATGNRDLLLGCLKSDV
jgi:hypothetical protein